MTRLHFENTAEFETLFSNKKKNVTDAIVSGIEKAMQSNRRSALLFEVSFENADKMFEISLPISQWQQALNSALEHYHQLELSDEAIDTWKLLEAVKVW
jgi:hypothetical protein